MWSGSEDGYLKVWESMLVGLSDEVVVDLTSRRGWLEAKSYVMFWSKRWVVLSDGFLRLYKHQHYGPEEQSLSLKEVIEVKTEETERKGEREIILVCGGNTKWNLRGEEGEVRKWEEIIKRAINRDVEKRTHPLCSYSTGNKVTCLVVVDEVVWAVEAHTLHEYTLATDQIERGFLFIFYFLFFIFIFIFIFIFVFIFIFILFLFFFLFLFLLIQEW